MDQHQIKYTMAFLVNQQLIDSKKLPITILFSLLLFNLVAPDNYLGFTLYRCVTSYNQTGLNDYYQANLQPLFNNFTNTAYSSTLRFYTTSAGKSPHKSYGMYLCRGDATSEICRSCVTNTTADVSSNDATANCTDFLAFADYCTVRFANYSLFGKANDADLGLQPGEELFNNKVSEVYKRTLESAVENVTTEAANNGTSFFATTIATVYEHEKVYALAQCTPDISKGECNRCLKVARASVQNTTGYLKGAWEMLPSCQLKYDNSSFFGGSTPTSKSEATTLIQSCQLRVIAYTMFIVGLV